MPGFDGYEIYHNNDGSITFLCSPKDAGTYRISVERDGQLLNGLPMCCVVQVSDTGYVTAYKTAQDIDEDLMNHAETLQAQLPEISEVNMSFLPVEELAGLPVGQTADGNTLLQNIDQLADESVTAGKSPPIGQISAADFPTILTVDPHSLESGESKADTIEESMNIIIDEPKTLETNLSLPPEACADPALIDTQESVNCMPDTVGVSTTGDSCTGEADAKSALEASDECTKMDAEEPGETKEEAKIELRNLAATEPPLPVETDVTLAPETAEDPTLMETQEVDCRSDTIGELNYPVLDRPVTEETDDVTLSAKDPAFMDKKDHDHLSKTKDEEDAPCELMEMIDNGLAELSACKEEKQSGTEAVEIKSEQVEPQSPMQTRRQSGRAIAPPTKYRDGGFSTILPTNQKSLSNCSQSSGRLRNKALPTVLNSIKKHVESLGSRRTRSKTNSKAESKPVQSSPESHDLTKSIKASRRKRKSMSGIEKEESQDVEEKMQKKLRAAADFLVESSGEENEKKNKDKIMLINEENVYPCGKCERVFNTLWLLNLHMDYHDEPVFICKELKCKRQFTTYAAMKRHRGKFHQGSACQKEVEAIPCAVRLCQATFSTVTDMRDHLNDSHGDKCVCDVCFRVIASRGKLIEHSQTHAQENNFSCDYCDGKFKTKRLLELHLAERKNQSNQCSMVYAPLHRPKGQGKPEESLICDVCGKLMKTKWSLKQHIRDMHVMEQKTVIDEDQNIVPLRPFKCDYCGKGFKRKGALKEHTSIHEPQSPVKCTYEGCEKMYPSIYRLNQHLRNGHRKKDKTYPCPLPGCNAVFKSSPGLGIHYKKQHEKIRYRCMEKNCEAEFTTKFCMQSHYKLKHEGTEGVPCPLCPKQLTTKAHLKRHMITHKSEKNHKCTECGKSFKSPFTLRSHTKIHFPDQQYHCEFCNKSFPRKHRLKEHMKSKHTAKGSPSEQTPTLEVQDVEELEHVQYQEVEFNQQIITTQDVSEEMLALPKVVTFKIPIQLQHCHD